MNQAGRGLPLALSVALIAGAMSNLLCADGSIRCYASMTTQLNKPALSQQGGTDTKPINIADQVPPTPKETSWSESTKDVTASLQSIATIVAFLVGGYWTYFLFVQKRQRYRRVEVTHRIKSFRLPDGRWILLVIVRISNLAEVFLSCRYIRTRVQRILPLNPDAQITQLINTRQDPVRDGETRIRWPTVGRRLQRWQGDEIEIEPGESYEFPFDFILDSDLQAIRIYSSFSDEEVPRDSNPPPRVWDRSTIYNLRDSGNGKVVPSSVSSAPKEEKV
jgi:hypothetical protein